MRLHPKPLKKFFRFLFALLWRRIKIVAEQRYTLGIFLIAIALVPISWFFVGPGLEYAPFLFIFGFAGFCGLLRYPKRDPEGKSVGQRKNTRHPFPSSLFWVIQLNGWMGLIALLFVVLFPDLFTKSGWKTLLSIPLFFSLLSLSATLLPTFVVFTPSFLFRLSRLVRIRLPRIKPAHFYTVLIMVGGLIALGDVAFEFITKFKNLTDKLIGGGIIALTCLGPLAVRARMFQRAYPGYSVGIPNLGFWGLTALLVVLGVVNYVIPELNRLVDKDTCGLLFLGVATLYLLYLPYGIVVGYLKADLVPRVQRQGRDKALSIQSTPGLYIDEQGYGQRIRQFIDTSDGGVIGITGVRGAGKSALIGHVLSKYESEYFTLPLTAPVKHEGGLSFFLAVCRSVCGRVLRDAAPVLYGRKTKERQALFEIFGYVRNGLLVLFLVGVGLTLFIGSDSLMWFDGLSPTSPSRISNVGSLEREKRFVKNSLSQIDALLGKAEGSEKTLPYSKYIIVPTYGKSGLSILPKRYDVAVSGQLQDLLANYTKPSPFLSKCLDKLGSGHTGKLILLENVFDVFDSRNFFYDEVADRIYMYLIRESLDEDLRGITEKVYSSPHISAGLNHHLPLLQKHLGFLASNPSTGEPSKDQRELPRLASSLFFQAFTEAKETLSYDQKRLQKLRNLLSTYLYILEGKPTSKAPILGSQTGESSWFVTALSENQGLVLVLLLVLLIFGLGGKLWQMANFILRGLTNFKILSIFRESQDFIELLSYSETKADSAGVTFQGLSWGRSKTLVTRDLTLPGLTARYLNYVRTLQPYYNGKLIIAIDELDKIHDPEMVKALLTELKGGLFEKGCYYLISISQDAARSFRSRLASGRDIFESTFDDVVEVTQMTSGTAIPMVQKRLSTEKKGRKS